MPITHPAAEQPLTDYRYRIKDLASGRLHVVYADTDAEALDVLAERRGYDDLADWEDAEGPQRLQIVEAMKR